MSNVITTLSSVLNGLKMEFSKVLYITKKINVKNRTPYEKDS